ncbi:cardiolipin synthase [Lachnospiraceae bacterium]|nr:cardiolipin synthase [Lachnospiraceae bacterium]
MQKMRVEQKTNVKNGVKRLVFAALSVLFQVSWFTVLVVGLSAYFTYISIGFSVVALIIAVRLYSRHTNNALKMPWIIVILAFPVMGLTLYLLTGHSRLYKTLRHRFHDIAEELNEAIPQDMEIVEEMREEAPERVDLAEYLSGWNNYPVYRNTDVHFYAEAIDGLHAQIEDLKNAENFIFLEYHAIEDKESFAPMKEILIEKAAAGVDVRIFYDDMGSLWFINGEFKRQMEDAGIKCRVFNPIVPFLNMFMNNRDHRKILVIDGKVGYTGGYNLANEYFNLTHPFGYWKDTGIRLEGDAVATFTALFLTMWYAMEKKKPSFSDREDFTKFFPEINYTSKDNGFVQPYGDSPLDHEPVGENVYISLVNRARNYVWFVTPYLILSDDMIRSLTFAAKRGVDVRIITPGIPDKKFVYQMTRSYYASLVSSGVKIYEYTPGFSHAKMCITDGIAGTVGTINMDFRSFYLHFENGVLLSHCKALNAIHNDFIDMIEASEEVTEQYKKDNRSYLKRSIQCILRLIAPLF